MCRMVGCDVYINRIADSGSLCQKLQFPEARVHRLVYYEFEYSYKDLSGQYLFHKPSISNQDAPFFLDHFHT